MGRILWRMSANGGGDLFDVVTVHTLIYAIELKTPDPPPADIRDMIYKHTAVDAA